MEKLGIELPLLLTQIVNFTIMLIILTKLLYKPILKSLNDRRKKIEEGLAFIEKAKKEEEKLASRKQEIVKEARDEAKVIFENAKKEAKKMKEEMILEGKKEVENMKVKLLKEMAARSEKLKSELVAQTVDIATQMSERVLGDILGSDEQHKIITKELQKLGKLK